MEQNEFRPVSPVRKKIKKVTLAAAISLGVVCFILGLLFGGAFSGGKDLDEAQQKIEELEFQLEDHAAYNQELEDTYIEQIEDLKAKNQDLKNQLNSTEKASGEINDGTDASASERGDEEKKSSGGFLKTFIIVILVIVVIVCLLFAASIFLKKNGHVEDDDDYYDDDEDDDDYYDDDDEDEDYEDDEDEDEDEE